MPKKSSKPSPTRPKIKADTSFNFGANRRGGGKRRSRKGGGS